MSRKKKITRNYWKAEEETIIQQWADKAQCYQWMHSKCREIYQTKNAWYTIPVIIISTITGTANFAQDRFSEDIKSYVVMGIGSLSIIAGIITTVHQFLKISEYNEGHRVAAISWGKFHNTLKTLGLRHPLDRMPPNDAIKIYQEEYERLIEISPDILKHIIIKFNYTFKKNNTLNKPAICNKLNPTETFQMTPADRQKMIDRLNNKKAPNKKFINTFFELNGREPLEEEFGNIEPEEDNITDFGSENISLEIESGTDNSSYKSKSIVDEDEDEDEDEEEAIDFVNTAEV